MQLGSEVVFPVRKSAAAACANPRVCVCVRVHARLCGRGSDANDLVPAWGTQGEILFFVEHRLMELVIYINVH